MSSTIKYFCPATIIYHSKRYDKWVTVPKGFGSDGSSGAVDIYSQSWWVHDLLCVTGTFDDGTTCTNLQASFVLYDILKSEGRWFRKYTWFAATYLFGEAKKLLSSMYK